MFYIQFNKCVNPFLNDLVKRIYKVDECFSARANGQYKGAGSCGCSQQIIEGRLK